MSASLIETGCPCFYPFVLHFADSFPQSASLLPAAKHPLCPGYGLHFILPYFPPMYNLRICKITVFPGFAALFPVTKESSHRWLLSLEKVFLLMGCSKNYIMYWGFYEYYYSITPKISVHKVHKNDYLFLCIFYSFLYIRFYWQSNFTSFTVSGRILICVQTMPQTPRVRSFPSPQAASHNRAVPAHVF